MATSYCTEQFCVEIQRLCAQKTVDDIQVGLFIVFPSEVGSKN